VSIQQIALDQARAFWRYKTSLADVTRATARGLGVYLADAKPNAADAPADQLLSLAAEAASKAQEELQGRNDSYFSRPPRRWISICPSLSANGDMLNQALDIMAKSRFVLDREVAEPLFKEGTEDKGLTQFGEQVPAIIEEGAQGFNGHMMVDSRGRLYHDARGIGWQGSPAWRASIRYSHTYQTTETTLLSSFEEITSSAEAQATLAAGPKSCSATAWGEAIAWRQAKANAWRTNYISQIDMSASGAWFIAALTGDNQLWTDLLSGDLYTCIGKWLDQRLQAMPGKGYRNFCKVLIMLTMYNATGSGLYWSLFNNKPEIFQSFMSTLGLTHDGSTMTKAGINALNHLIGRLLQHYPGLKLFREWSLNAAKDKRQISWTMNTGFTARHCTWKWKEELTQKEIKALNLDPLKAHSAGHTDCRFSTPWGSRTVKLNGVDFGYGYSARGLGPNMVHSVDAAVAAGMIIGMDEEHLVPVPTHDAYGCDCGSEDLVNQIFTEVFPQVIESNRPTFLKLGMPYQGNPCDYKAMKKLHILR
jgi:hypothetical protein